MDDGRLLSFFSIKQAAPGNRSRKLSLSINVGVTLATPSKNFHNAYYERWLLLLVVNDLE